MGGVALGEIPELDQLVSNNDFHTPFSTSLDYPTLQALACRCLDLIAQGLDDKIVAGEFQKISNLLSEFDIRKSD